MKRTSSAFFAVAALSCLLPGPFGALRLEASPNLVGICHYTGANNAWIHIRVSAAARDAHLSPQARLSHLGVPDFPSGEDQDLCAKITNMFTAAQADLDSGCTEMAYKNSGVVCIDTFQYGPAAASEDTYITVSCTADPNLYPPRIGGGCPL